MDRYKAYLALMGDAATPDGWLDFMHQMRVLYHGAEIFRGLHPIVDPDHFTAFILDHAVLYVPASLPPQE